MKAKLLRVERSICIHGKDNEFYREVDIDIPLEKLLEFIIPVEDDLLLYLGYDLDKDQMERINSFLKEPILTDYDKENYVLVALGIYDW